MDLLQFSNSSLSSVRIMQPLFPKQHKTSCIRSFKIHIENYTIEINTSFILTRYALSFRSHLLGNATVDLVLLAKATMEFFQVFVFLAKSFKREL